MTADGQVLLRMRHSWTDGTTHLLFEPTELLERLAVLTPRPRVNLILYYGVLACPRCGHAMRLIALIEEPDVIRRILRHLGETSEVPAPAPARPPPQPREDADGASRLSEESRATACRFLEPAADDPC